MYVALTRAKEQLILIGTIDKEEALEKLELRNKFFFSN
jgi:ATP-dependent helicase/nuclease subunit A